MNVYYVYQYLREDRSPYYIGKGKNKRAWNHGKQERIHPPKDKTRIEIIEKELSEDEAHLLEIKLIAQYGRLDLGTGILQNQTDGGEGSSGAKRTPERIKQQSTLAKGRKLPAFTEEHKAKLSAAKKGKTPWNKGIKTGPESEETKQRKSLSKIGKAPNNKGKINTDEYKAQQSLRMSQWWSARKEMKNG